MVRNMFGGVVLFDVGAPSGYSERQCLFLLYNSACQSEPNLDREDPISSIRRTRHAIAYRSGKSLIHAQHSANDLI